MVCFKSSEKKNTQFEQKKKRKSFSAATKQITKFHLEASDRAVRLGERGKELPRRPSKHTETLG